MSQYTSFAQPKPKIGCVGWMLLSLLVVAILFVLIVNIVDGTSSSTTSQVQETLEYQSQPVASPSRASTISHSSSSPRPSRPAVTVVNRSSRIRYACFGWRDKRDLQEYNRLMGEGRYPDGSRFFARVGQSGQAVPFRERDEVVVELKQGNAVLIHKGEFGLSYWINASDLNE